MQATARFLVHLLRRFEAEYDEPDAPEEVISEIIVHIERRVTGFEKWM